MQNTAIDKPPLNSLPTRIWHEVQQNKGALNKSALLNSSIKNSQGIWEFYKPTQNSELIFAQIKQSLDKTICLRGNEQHVNLCFTRGCHLNVMLNSRQPYLIPSEHASIFSLPKQTVSLQLKASPCAVLFVIQLPLDALPHYIQSSMNLDTQIPQSQHFRLSKKMSEIIDTISQDQSPPDLRAYFVNGKVYELINDVLQHFDHQDSDTLSGQCHQENVDITQKAEAILHKLYTSPPSLDQLARRIGTNRNKLSNSFKVIHGKTVFEYCQEYRMSIAKRMLSKHELSISRIAELVGYEHASNFTSAYKRHYGELPKATQRLGY